jgi:hypothetical protein
MAKRTRIIMIDDLDGEEIVEGGKTVTFGHSGTSYEIDLTEKNARRLHDVLAPYIAAARRVGARSLSTSAGPANKSELHAMRSWAKQQGFKVSDRGRVSKEVQQAYRSAH